MACYLLGHKKGDSRMPKLRLALLFLHYGKLLGMEGFVTVMVLCPSPEFSEFPRLELEKLRTFVLWPLGRQ